MVMPFGLSGAPGTFQRLMEAVLQGLQYEICLVYLDDVVVFSRTLDEHLTRLRAVFDRFRDANLKMKPKKCNFLKQNVVVLGHVSDQGLATDPSKTEVVDNWPVPKCTTEIRQFLGMASYYRRFIKNFAQIAAPLKKLLQNETKQFCWTSDHDHAFKTLKLHRVTAPILA